MSDWEKYFEKVICKKNNGEFKDEYPYIYSYKLYVKSPIIYRYRNKKATELENNLPMPPTDSFEDMFWCCESLENIDALKNWNTRNVKYMSKMFLDCELLKNIDALKSWDTRNVIDMKCMFACCETLTNIDALKSWDTRNVIDIRNMFRGCHSLTNIDGLNNWDTRNVENMNYMFRSCYSLTNIDALKNWDTRNVKEMNDMFKNCDSLNLYPKNLYELKLFTTKNKNNFCSQFIKPEKFVCNFEELPNSSTTVKYWDDIKMPSWS